jgi:drug/metabolite transporter (DMT)-like permease
MSHGRAILLLILVSVLWSLGGVLIKGVEWHPLAVAGTRSGIAAIVFLVFLGRPQIRWSLNQIVGAIAYVGTVALFVVATKVTTAANAIFLQYTAPIYVALLGPALLGERPRPADWWCVGIALIGILLFFRDQFSIEGGWGMAAALGSGFCFGIMVMFLRRERTGSPHAALLLGNVATAFLGVPFMISSPIPPAGAWIALIALGVFQLGLPYILYGIAIKRVTALEAMLIPMLEPILNPIWVALVRQEIPGPWSLAGGALVLVAVAIRAFGHKEAAQ